MNCFTKSFLKIKTYFTTGHERSIKAKKNIVLLFIFKGLSAIISLLTVPLALNYLDSIRYGIWLTLASIIEWVSFLDIGLGNGLRNKFTEAKTKNQTQLAKIYVSTTYAILSIIIAVVFILFILVNVFLDWTEILNAPKTLRAELNTLVITVFALFCLEFIARLINTVLIADQRPATSSFISLIANILTLLFLFLLSFGKDRSLLYAGISLSISRPIVLIIASFYFYLKNYKEYRPSIKNINWRYSKQLMNLGVKFFFIQMSVIIIFFTSNILITQLFSPSKVTVYNIAYKYFSVIIMIFGIIVSPFWSAYTEAYIKQDILWIKKITSKLIKVWLITTILVIIMILVSTKIYHLWVGSNINIPTELTILMGVYVLIHTWNSIFTSFINGIGKVKLQLYLSIFAGIFFIPLAIFWGKTIGLNVSGVLLALCSVLIPGTISGLIQYKKIINNSAKGIWNK